MNNGQRRRSAKAGARVEHARPRHPFKAALAFAEGLKELHARLNGTELLAALRELPPLRHRGNGGGRPFVKGANGIGRSHFVQAFKMKDGTVRQVAWPIDRSRYQPHQGERERARRVA